MGPHDLVIPLDFKVDLSRLQSEVSGLLKRDVRDKSTGQIGLTHRPGCDPSRKYIDCVGSLYDFGADRFKAQERDFTEFNQELHGSYLHWIYQNVPFKPARVRIMTLQPKRCLTLHDDTGPRYHFAVFTNPGAFLVFPRESKIYHVPADGQLYKMDAEKFHTAMNCDVEQERVHLVFSDYERC